MAGKRKCIVCRQEYDYCPNCSDEQPRWRFLFDTQNCNHIWDVFNDYRTGQKDATQAEKALRQLDLSKENDFDPTWKELLAKIRSEAVPVPEPEREEPKRYKHEFNREKDKKK